MPETLREQIAKLLRNELRDGSSYYPEADQILAIIHSRLKPLSDEDGEYIDNLLQKMIGEVPQLRRLWVGKDTNGEMLQDNIKLGIVFDLLEHLHKHYQAQLKVIRGKLKRTLQPVRKELK